MRAFAEVSILDLVNTDIPNEVKSLEFRFAMLAGLVPVPPARHLAIR